MPILKRGLVDESGFTLVTVAVCVVITAITAVGMYNAIILGNRYIADSRRVTKATSIARSMLEKLVDDPTCTDYYPEDMELPNMSWQVEYLDNYGTPVMEYEVGTVDPLTIRLTVFWQRDNDSRQRSVQLATKITQKLT